MQRRRHLGLAAVVRELGQEVGVVVELLHGLRGVLVLLRRGQERQEGVGAVVLHGLPTESN
jgi:hypothetical protein